MVLRAAFNGSKSNQLTKKAEQKARSEAERQNISYIYFLLEALFRAFCFDLFSHF